MKDPDLTDARPAQAIAAASAPTQLVVRAGTRLNGKFEYEIDSQLGKGGFGAVYLARTVGTPQGPEAPPDRVAVKIFEAPAGKDPVKLLKRELSALLALKHDRIPRVYDWSIEGPAAFVVMEYFPYGSLLDASPYGVALGSQAAWRLLIDLLQALRIAHAQSVLHLDIKPANVLLDGNGGFVLTDFGISQGANVSRKIVAPSLGSPGYQSPEQKERRFDEIDARTDLWGVGITIWSMFTGVALWLRPELFETDPTRAYYGVPPMTQFRPDCPQQLNEIVMSLLAIHPGHRPGGAPEVLARIRAMMNENEVGSDTFAAARASKIDRTSIDKLIDELVDPLWISICRAEGFERFFVRFDDGENLCKQGEKSYFAYVLLNGKIEIERDGTKVFTEDREGTFLGEVATLTGDHRTATMRACGPVWCAVFNAAELEKFVTVNPAVGIRLIKSLAQRLQRESARAMTPS